MINGIGTGGGSNQLAGGGASTSSNTTTATSTGTLKRTPSMSQLARQATTRAAQRSWQKIRRVHPHRMQHAITALFLFVLLVVATKTTIKAVQRWRKCRPTPTDDALGYSDPQFPKNTAYVRSGKLERTRDSCAEAANFPQVALLLLTKQEVAHDALWREWFSLAAGKLPATSAKSVFCAAQASKKNAKENEEDQKEENEKEAMRIKNVVALCLPEGNPAPKDDVIARQHLFDVWVHTLVDFKGFPPGSTFKGRELPPEFRVKAVWGTHTLVDATRALLAAALTNPRNQKFVLLSESDVPLYSPLVLYAQMMAEPGSRVNACNGSASSMVGRTYPGWNHNDGNRLRDDMIAEGLTLEVWRKSWQWIALTRKHAELAVKDADVDAAFRATCRRRWDPDWCDHRVCYSDEHYFPTLLASLGLENETDCFGELTDRDWSRVASTDPHPWEYRVREVSPELLLRLRHTDRPGCGHSQGASAMAKRQFVDVGAVVATAKATGASTEVVGLVKQAVCELPRSMYRPLGPYCPLLARKFLNHTREAVLAAVLPCEKGLGIVNDPTSCETEAARRQHGIVAGLSLGEFESEGGDEDGLGTQQKNGEKNLVHRVIHVLGFIVFGGMVVLAIGVGVFYKRQRRLPSFLKSPSKRLPLAHSESFHTQLRHYGVIE